MIAILCAVSALAWVGLFFLRGYFWRIERPPPAPRPSVWPSVVALIPARDEAGSIATTIRSLLAQDYPGRLSLVLTDDGSADGTADIARTTALDAGAGDRLTVVTAPPLAPGWRGKMWAQYHGWEVARTLHPEAGLLLLTDADITHAPGELTAIVARVLDQQVDLASLMVRLSTTTPVEKAIIPAFVFFFRLLYPFAWVADPARSTAAAAGGYMVIRRPVFERIGGFDALREALIDDCELARRVKRAGGRVTLDLTEATASSRPYGGIADLWMMIARSAYTQLNHSPLLLAGTVAAMSIAFLLPPIVVLSGGHGARFALSAWIAMAITYAPMLVYYRVSLMWAPLLPLTALFYLAATIDSARRYAGGQGGVWKGRFQATAAIAEGAVEHASGKGAAQENFPVGSLLIPARLRRHVHCFYRYARHADDIADAADLDSAEKLRRLDRMGAVLDGAPGDDAPSATAMRESLRETGVDPAHCHDLLAAFRQDAVQSRYPDWASLMAYCRLSAAPVGRYLLDLHGESQDTWPSSDALCAALQVINHLQDCATDYRQLDRVYLPEDWLGEVGIGVEALAAATANPPLRRVLDRCVAATQVLVDQARALPTGIRHLGLRCETAIIVALAQRLLDRLARQDPLATRVALGPLDVAGAAVDGLYQGLMGGRR